MKFTNQIKQKIPLFHSAVSFVKINKGFSYEEKWMVKLHNGEELFIKIYDSNKCSHAKSVYTYLEKFYNAGLIVPRPIQFIELPDDHICIQIVANVSGFDGEEYLQTLSNEQQYLLGYQAGKELLKLHSFKQETTSTIWEVDRLTKYERYLDALNDSTISFEGLDTIFKFVDKHKNLLKNRPIKFLHDDFHPANLLFNKGELTSVIDFDRYEFGDPYHDFHKVALFTRKISKQFAIGQIDGYFSNEPTEEFWDYYALYTAMIIPSDIIWSYKTTPHLIDSMWKRVNQILEDHDNFKQKMPKWYKVKV